MPDIKIDLIRQSPYQPRLRFDLEDIKGSIKTHGIVDPLAVRKRDGYFELIDGERRLRVAKELGFKTVPIRITEADDEEADAISWNVNTIRKTYTVEERAKHFKMHQDQGMSARAIGRRHGYSDRAVGGYLRIFRLPEKYQKWVWAGKIGIFKIQRLYERGLLNGDAKAFAPALRYLDQAVAQELSDDEFVKLLYKTAGEVESLRLGVAEKAIGKVKPKAKPPETAEEFEEAAKTLRRKAKELLTPEQKAREKRKKQIAQAKISLNATVKKIDKARETLDVSRFSKRLDKIKNALESDPVGAKDQLTALGKEVIAAKGAKKSLDATVKKIDDAEKILDVGGFRKRFNKIKSTLERDPTEAKDQLVALGKEVAEAKKQRQAELKENARRKREEATKIKLKMEAEEKAKAELLKDKEFLRAVAEGAETVELLPEPEEKPPKERPIPPEELEGIQRRREEISKRMAAVFSRPDVKRRGKLLKNWLAHGAVADVAGSLFCPKCGKPHNNLQWVCDKIPVVKAYGLAGEEMDKEAKKRGKK